MSTHDHFMEAANRYRPEPGPTGVRTWASVLEVVDAVKVGNADPFNNYYDENHFDDSPRPPEEANRIYTDRQFKQFESYNHEVRLGAMLYVRQNRDANFSNSEQVDQRVKDAHAVGSIVRAFVAAAKEMSDGVQDNFEFERRVSSEIERLYRRSRTIMLRVDFSLDALVDFTIKEHNRETGGLLSAPHRRAIRNFARIGRKAIGLNGGNGSDGPVPIG